MLMHESQSLSWLVLFGGRNTNKYPSWVLPFIGTSADPIANFYIPEYEFEARVWSAGYRQSSLIARQWQDCSSISQA